MNIKESYKKFGINLEQSGDKWKSLCPFHNENLPSFFVYNDGSFHCFGCGSHGLYKDFIKKLNKEDDNIVLVELENLKENEIFKLQILKKHLDSELYILLEDKSYEIKNTAWKMFDTIWINLDFLNYDEELDLVETILFMRSEFSKICSFIKENS